MNNIHELSNRVVVGETLTEAVLDAGELRVWTKLLIRCSAIVKKPSEKNLNESNIAACHLWSSNPKSLVIIKFSFQADRDFIRRKK